MADDRFISPCKPPEGRAREILEIMIEECAEVQQRITKALRFGILEIQPDQPHTNAARIGHEIGDLFEIINVAINERLIPFDATEIGRSRKRRQLAKYMQNQISDKGDENGRT